MSVKIWENSIYPNCNLLFHLVQFILYSQMKRGISLFHGRMPAMMVVLQN